MGAKADPRTVAGRVLLITENPIDALLLEHRYPESCAVATLGVALWRDEWTELLVRSGALLVVVMFDNDRPGNGAGRAGQLAWMRTHDRDIMPNGIRLVNRLLRAGVNAQLYDWGDDAPLHQDAGSALLGECAR